MGDPVPIYQLCQQPAKPQLTSSDHEVAATYRLSGMSEVGHFETISPASGGPDRKDTGTAAMCQKRSLAL
jgi:hypothetical protein